jgi:AcrR family transcriptional regulator
MGIKERRKRDAERMRKSILQAAMQLFAKGGYENVSMRRIAKKIEYSPGTIYIYFKNKNDIMLQLCYQGFEQLINLQKELDKISDPVERLRKGGRYYISFALENPELYELMFATEEIVQEPPLDEESAPLMAFRNFENHVQRCLDVGVFSGEDAEPTAVALWASLHGLASLLIKQRLRFLPEDKTNVVVQQALEFTLRRNRHNP